jgi:ABC-type transport system involved in Fe-S cluster assembly fused permease/ATPase subunit
LRSLARAARECEFDADVSSEEVFDNMALILHSGKSSLLRLLYRFYDVTGGEILIDGQNIRNLTQQSLRAALGIVPQEPVLWNDTIGESLSRQNNLALLT